ncbi:MAG: cytidylyltransferase domain-containing protein [Candidatus Hermodarchaeota archaeon]
MKILGTICARGGSKGIKNKNIRMLLGKPLIAHSIETLKAWGKADRIVCSTDSQEIQKIARDYGAETPFVRPKELAADTAGKLDVLKHMLKFCEDEEDLKYDYIVDLDPTSPLRLVKDIENAIKILNEKRADLILSVYKAHKNPYFNMIELNNEGYAQICKKSESNLVSRQQAPQVYSVNASIYIYRRDYLANISNLLEGKVGIYEMPDYSIDIDRPIDFDFIEFIVRKGVFKFDY